MKMLDRRSFLKHSMLAAASTSLLPAWSRVAAQSSTALRVPGANSDIRVAVIGLNGRGRDHLSSYLKLKGVRVVAVCDADQEVLDRTTAKLKESGGTVATYTDLRKLLENPDIDAVSLATPNHWHSLGTVWAAQAGKDVYVEKPVSHNVFEGRQAVRAARKYQRIVQSGTQCRSSQGLIEAVAWVQSGQLGKILRARGLCYKRRASIGKVEGPQPIPASVNYDLWCGPAPQEPLLRKHLHYDWHWVWPTGNGDLGNQGVHQVDIARWVLGEAESAPRVFTVGGRLGYVDDGTTPNTFVMYHDYQSAPLIFEVRGLPAKSGEDKMDNYHGASIGVVIDCEGGRMVIPSYNKAIVYDRNDKEIKKFEGGGDHYANFIAAVRSRKADDLRADIEVGHVSAALCHTANISYRLGQKLTPDQLRAKVRENADLAEAYGRMEEHLKANAVDLDQTPLTWGAALNLEVKAERFVNNEAANAMLTRNYRAPFVVPQQV